MPHLCLTIRTYVRINQIRQDPRGLTSVKLGVASGSSFAAVTGMTLAAARAELADLRHRRAELDARILEVVSHIESLATAEHPEFALTHRELIDHAGLTPREAKATVARAEVADAEPAFGELLAAGTTSTGHLDAVARAFATLGSERHKLDAQLPELAYAAATMPVGEFAAMVTTAARALLDDGGIALFERQRRSTHLTANIDTDGGVRLTGYFDPERKSQESGCSSPAPCSRTASRAVPTTC